MKNYKEFLINLQTQLRFENKYDNDIQASPRFWVIMDCRWVPTWDGDVDKSVVVVPNYADSYDIDDLLESEKEDGELPQVAFDDMDKIVCEITALDWIREWLDENAYLVPVREESFIVPNTMFLTKKEAKKHLKLNHYHYTEGAHTYAMTAWRSPVVERLLSILNNADLKQILK